MSTTGAVPLASNGSYKRVLLKLSGEVFGGGSIGVDPDVARRRAPGVAMQA